jgi:hypothetical protein
MSEARKLLIRALAVLEEARLTDCPDWELGDDIRAELAKPEPVDHQHIVIKNGRQVFGYTKKQLPDGNYRLLAVRIDDATPE